MSLTYELIRDNAILYINIGLEKYTHLLLYKQWRFFYSLEGDASPIDTSCTNNKEIPEYVERMLYKFETAFILLTQSFSLRNPLEGGFFYEKGAKFIDIYIDNIPKEHGKASGIVFDESFEILKNTPYQGKSLKITIHKNLIQTTVTPMHELFHVFQYSYTHFNNMWFMEGLARWSQSIMQEKTGSLEPLPQTEEEVDMLVHKLHDAEFFFNNLITLADTESTFVIPQELQNNSEIYNNKKTGASFMKIFLENCEKQYRIIQEKSIHREIQNLEYWPRYEKRMATNNQYIFRAIIDTVEQLRGNQKRELSNFITLITPLANPDIQKFNTPTIQIFLKTIQKISKKSILVSDEGILYCEFFDIFTGTLSLNKIDFTNSDLTDEELKSFEVLKRVHGSLIFKNCKNITNLNGLNNLIFIDGDLIISQLNINTLLGCNNLKSVNTLQINFMENLISIGGFLALEHIRNVEIRNTKVSDCNFLKNSFQKNPDFLGFIKIYNNKLDNIDFMSGVKTVKSSLFLHQNNLVNLEGLQYLQSIGGSFSLSSNKIDSLKALKSLTSVNGLLALSYNNLHTLEGLENLTSLKTKQWGEIYFTLKIYGNKNLRDISALSNLQTQDNYLIIYFDYHLQYLQKPHVDSNFHKNILELHDYKTKKLIPTYKFISKHTHNYNNFRATTHNKLLTSLFDFEIECADILVLSFTGAYGNLGGIFYNKYPLLIDNIQTHKIFIMDTNHTWYNGGISPFTKNMDENIAFIKELILDKKYKKVICMGTSMGAYFSLVLGSVLANEIDEVLAFSPQIFLDRENRKKHNDTRWETLIKNFPINIKKEYLDLKLLFEQHLNTRTRFQIHYGVQSILDNAHAQHLPQKENIILIPYDVNSHYITVMLREQNKLDPIILNILKG